MQPISPLIDYHLNEEANADRSWHVAESKLSGRGVFAVRDIRPGEIIFSEKPLLIGPTAGKESNLQICSVCYNILNDVPCTCPKGCSLPVCELCVDSKQHSSDCDLFRLWEPVDSGKVDRKALRALVVARGLSLNEKQKQLVYAMQANTDPSYRKEISNMASSFANFPVDRKTLEYFYRIVCVLNTNAFEALQQDEKGDTSLRGLYPLCGIMNHECTPNTCHYYVDNQVMVVKSAKFIPSGAEITTTYTKILWSNLSRKIFLNMTKKFECCCSRCLDPTENGSYLSALLCRAKDCQGWIIPQDCNAVKSDWQCLKCGVKYDSKHISKTQDFTLRIFNGKISSGTLKDVLEFIREKAARICPPTSQFIIELKLHVIWKMTKSDEKFSKQDIQDAMQYCRDILSVLEKLEAGECTLKALLLEEINKFNEML